MSTTGLSFRFARSPETNDDEVRVLIDGRDLLEADDDHLGLDPPDFFAQPGLLSGGWVTFARCGCGDVGCGSRGAEVLFSGDTVTWQEGPARLGVFSLPAYTGSIRSAARDTSWESTARTAERLVEQLDFAVVTGPEFDFAFEFASARNKPGFITLAFRGRQLQRLFEVAWNQAEPEDAQRQVAQWLKRFKERTA